MPKEQYTTQSDIPMREKIYTNLAKDITSGKIVAGEKLSEPKLIKRFKVSRTPIREALFKLEKDGFIILIKNKGAFVKGVSAVQIAQMLDVTALLEGYAVEITVVSGVSQEEVEMLNQMVMEAEQLAKEGNYSHYLKINDQFHGFFQKKCANDFLSETVSDLNKKLASIRGRGSTLPRHTDTYLQSHRSIIDAILANDANKARDAMRNHILDAKKYIIFMND